MLEGFAVGTATVANGPGIHHCHGADTGAGDRRDYFDFYFGSRRSTKVLAGSASRRIVPARQIVALLLPGWLQSRKRVLPCLLRSVQILSGQHQRLFGIGGLPGARAAVWRPTRGHVASCAKLSRRVCFRQLLHDVWDKGVRGARAYRWG